MVFKLGDRVKIRPGTDHYGRGMNNPTDVAGEVIEVKDWGFPYRVKWDDGTCNTYRDEDLMRDRLLPNLRGKKDDV